MDDHGFFHYKTYDDRLIMIDPDVGTIFNCKTPHATYLTDCFREERQLRDLVITNTFWPWKLFHFEQREAYCDQTNHGKLKATPLAPKIFLKGSISPSFYYYAEKYDRFVITVEAA